MKKPNFFIIGAPKCGTTSLANWLSGHPNVFVTQPKEPFFFDKDIKARYEYSLEEYNNLYKETKKNHLAIGEASTTYLYSNVAVQNIIKYNPLAKFIVLLRNPAQMVVSLHSQEVFSLHEDIKDFEKAWAAQDDRLGGKNIPKTCVDPKKLQYRDICKLGEQIERLLRIVPEDRVLFLSLDKLKDNSRGTYFIATDFLNLPRYDLENYANKNPSKSYKSSAFQLLILLGVFVRKKIGLNKGFGFSRFNMKVSEKKNLDYTFLKKIEKYFESDILKVKQLTGIDL